MKSLCPACGSDRPDVCNLLGHVYPVKPAAVIILQRRWGITPDHQKDRGPLRPPLKRAA